MIMELILTECGNGFPTIGELVGCWDDGRGCARVWLITSVGRITTGQTGSGQPNTCTAEGDELDEEQVEAALDSGQIDLDDPKGFLGLRSVSVGPAADDDA
jgi:hypothetical protein